ncbi:MAG: hypothetical protein BGO51_05635 [Rhodospirillales bacterium 69-11]|nr:Hint domain-containing protein [Rhodospirillales bacterium]OJW27205.1 MAG: hypothetical protein BGO51_05635 [Rhodospirillales bacterium 69-11]
MATLTWTKSGSGSWSVGSNWNTGTVPGAGDSVVMPGTNAYTVTLDVDPAALGTITVSDSKAKLLLNGYTLTATELDLAGSVTGFGALDVTTYGANGGTIQASGGTLKLFGSISGTPNLAIVNAANTNLEIDGTASVSAFKLNGQTLTIAGGGELTFADAGGWNTGQGTISMGGGTLTVDGTLTLGGSLVGYGVLDAGSLTPQGGSLIRASGGTLDVFGNTTAQASFVIDTAVPSTLRLEGTLGSQPTISITDANQTLQLAGSVTFTSQQTISAGTIDLVGGTISDGYGYLLSDGVLTGYGVVKRAGGPSVTLSGTGDVIANGGVLDLAVDIPASSGTSLKVADSTASIMRLDGTIGAGNTLSFLGSHGAIELNDVQIKADGLNFAGTIDGMVIGSTTNDVSGINYINVQGEVTDVAFVDSTHIRVSNGVTVLGTITLASPTTAPYVVLSLDSDTVGHTIGSGYDIFLSTVCYARGSHIATPTGEVRVEALAAGDEVLVLEGDSLVPHTVRWVGERRLDVQAHPRPSAVAPVRICRSAFAQDVPHRDLVLSPDHAVLLDGRLIPVRRLINHDTIVQDMAAETVDYFHVELDRHAILLAEGLPAESYLDTGNRGFFSNAGLPAVLYPDLTDEAEERRHVAASPLPFATSDAEVEQAWRRLADRAWLMRTLADSRITNEPALRLVCQGQALTPMTSRDGMHLFVLPASATQVRIESRASAPADTQPWSDDRRTLGVNLTRIVLRGPTRVEEIPVDHPRLHRGWWPVERHGSTLARWTDGCATLPLPPLDGVTILELHASAGGMRYVVEAEAARAA